MPEDKDKNSSFRSYSKEYQFPGFYGPNYTQVPDEAFDALMAQLSGAEFKVLMYVIRRTFGFKKGSDRISRSQLESGITKRDGGILDYGTGLSKRAVRIAVKSLREKGILTKIYHSSAKKGDEAPEFSLNILSVRNPWVQSTPGGQTPGVQNTPPLNGAQKVSPGGILSTPGGGSKVPPQETVRQETVNNTHSVSSSSTESREIVRRFHELRGHSEVSPTAKELAQASQLISTHGAERAAFLITHGFNTATDRFGSPPEAFGGILRFVDEGVATYGQLQQREERERQNRAQEKAEKERLEAERAARESLSPEERVQLRLKRFPKSVYSPHKLQEIERQICEEEGARPPA